MKFNSFKLKTNRPFHRLNSFFDTEKTTYTPIINFSILVNGCYQKDLSFQLFHYTKIQGNIAGIFIHGAFAFCYLC